VRRTVCGPPVRCARGAPRPSSGGQARPQLSSARPAGFLLGANLICQLARAPLRPPLRQPARRRAFVPTRQPPRAAAIQAGWKWRPNAHADAPCQAPPFLPAEPPRLHSTPLNSTPLEARASSTSQPDHSLAASPNSGLNIEAARRKGDRTAPRNACRPSWWAALACWRGAGLGGPQLPPRVALEAPASNRARRRPGFHSASSAPLGPSKFDYRSSLGQTVAGKKGAPV